MPEKEAVTKVPPKVIKDIRAIHEYKGQPEHPYYKVEERPGTGKATCRNCGQQIADGEPSIYFHWAPEKDKPWLRNRMSIHLDDCGDNEKDWTKCPKCQTDVPAEEWREHWMDHRYEKAAMIDSPASENYNGHTVKTADSMPPEPQAMEIGPEEEETVWFPRYNPVQLPEDVPTEEPSKTPEPAEPAKEPEKVPAHTGSTKVAMGDEAIGASGGNYLNKVPDHAHRTDQGQPIAYRVGLMTRGDKGEWYITSPVRSFKWDRGTQVSHCDSGGKAPCKANDAGGCNGQCGIYALWDEDEVAQSYKNPGKPAVVTQVVGSGRTRMGPKGIRMEESTVVGIRNPGCHYCAKGAAEDPITKGKSIKRDADLFSTAGWPSCQEHADHWEKHFQEVEGDDHEKAEWEDMHGILKSLGSYYGAEVGHADKPMRFQPGYEEESDDTADWDEELKKITRNFSSHSHYPSNERCSSCPPEPEVPPGWANSG